MSHIEVAALSGYAVAAMAMLLVTQTKQRVSWAGWLVPTFALMPLIAFTAYAFIQEGPSHFWPLLSHSTWGLLIWFNLLMAVTAAFFLLQNRARAAGMKSEVWVLVVIATGSMGIFLMLARTVYLERKADFAAARRD